MQYLREPIPASPTPRHAGDTRPRYILGGRLTHLCGIKQIDEPVTEAKREIEALKPARPAKPHTEYAQADPGFYPAQEYHKHTRTDPPRCSTGGKTMSASYTRREGNYLSVAGALERTKQLTPDHPRVTTAEKREPSCETLGDRAMTDIAIHRRPQPEEKTTPRNVVTADKPSIGVSVVGWTVQHLAAIPKEHDRRNHAYKDSMSGIPGSPRNSTERAPENESTQKAIPHRAVKTLEIGPESGTEVKEAWQHRDRLSLRHRTAMSPTKHRQAVMDILGVACRKDRVLWLKAGKEFSENANSRRVAAQPYPREGTGASRRNTSIRHSWKDNHRRVNKSARKPHRETGHTESRPEASTRTPRKAPRKNNPLYMAYTNASERSPLRRVREGIHYQHTSHGSSTTSGRDGKPAYSQGSAWGARGKARSADPNGPNASPANDGTSTRKTNPPGNQHGRPYEEKQVDAQTMSSQASHTRPGLPTVKTSKTGGHAR